MLGVFAGALALARALHEPGWPTDFDQFHFAARRLLQGGNPYDDIGPGRAFQWDWPLYYPLPSVLLVMPLAWLPVVAGRVVFATASGAVLGYALSREGLWRLPVAFSAAFMIAIFRSQWSPLITAAFFLPWAAVFLAAKPNVALPVLAGARSWRYAALLVGIGAVAGAISLVAQPAWPLDWWRALQTKHYVSAPVLNPGGFLLLLALVRWRRPEARVFAVLACIPQTPSLYDLLLLFLVPRTVRETTLLSLLTTALFAFIVATGPFEDFYRYAYHLERAATWIVWIPVLLMILRRPNVAGDDGPRLASNVSLRQWIEALPRVDAILLALAGASAGLLIWLTLNTQRL